MGDGDFSSVTLSSAKARQKKLCTMRLNDPVKKPYYKDTDSFGARMLSKLGWTEGKGLGRDENGITIPISNRVKLDTEGVGFVGGRDDMWTQHEAGFTELLRRLNGDESEPAEGAGDAVIDPKSQVQSLEERSKQSRARVHYTRFTRGKDLSRVNEKDLANIFGKRSLTETSKPREEEEQVSSESESADEDRPVLGLSTIKASMSMQDYFKEKMKQRAAAGNGVAPVEATVKTNGQGGEEEMVPEETHDGEKIKKKKSKKKAKENEQTVEPMEEAVAIEEAPATKKSKRKREQLEENEQEVLVNGDSVEPESEPSEPVKKKKKAKKHNSKQEPTVEVRSQACEVAEEEMGQMVDETVAAEEPVKKKKKSKKQTSEPELKVEPSSEVTEEEKVVPAVEDTATVDGPVRKKKKSKKNTSNPEPPVVETTNEVAEAELEPPTDTTATVEEPVKKKKKSKTPKSESSTEEDAVANPTPEPNTVEAGQETANTTETGASTSAKKKKKKKSKRAASPANGEVANNEPASSPAVNGTTEPVSNGKESVGPMDEITLQVAAGNALSAEYEGKSEETTCKVKVEVLKYLDDARFAGSNFGDIIGYRLTEDVKLVKNAASKGGGGGGPSRKFTPRRR
uniref:G-patch domain-containing protein n=1 Tax=Anopheles merus TaxID=30066 RepID=A0A182V840_ANOME